MKYVYKYAALMLALLLCLTALWGCGEKGPDLPETDGCLVCWNLRRCDLA